MRPTYLKKKGENLRKFKLMVVTSALLVGSYYTTDSYLKFTRDKTLVEYLLAAGKNWANSTKEEWLGQARDSESFALNELALFIDKYEGSSNNVNSNVNSNGNSNKIGDVGSSASKKSSTTHNNTASNSGESADEHPDSKPVAPSSSQKEFTQKHFIEAKAVEQTEMIPAIFMIGQAGHETAWGQREIRYSDGKLSYNLFGIKANSNWTGKTVDIMTTEHVKGRDVKMVQKFRAYDSYEDSFRDYARLINTSPRYERAREAAHNFAVEIQNAGYATDPNYAKKLETSILKAQR